MGRSGRRPRLHCSHVFAYPARHSPGNSKPRWSKVGASSNDERFHLRTDESRGVGQQHLTNASKPSHRQPASKTC